MVTAMTEDEASDWLTKTFPNASESDRHKLVKTCKIVAPAWCSNDTLWLYPLSGRFDEFPFQMRLPNLKYFNLGNVELPLPTQLCAWINHQIPSLKHLECYFCNKSSANVPEGFEFYNILWFQGNTMTLHCNCAVDQGRVMETLLLGLLPNFPGIVQLSVRSEGTDLFRSTVERIEHRKRAGMVSKLPHLRSVKLKEGNEKEMVLNRFLRAFSTIEYLAITFETLYTFYTFSYPSNKHELLLNRAGRRLLQGRDSGERPLPESVWPLVLARIGTPSAWRRLNFRSDLECDATAVYYLLREGPVLYSRNPSSK